VIRRILAAVDDSSRATHVVAKAVEVARSMGASIRLYHAVAIPPEFPPAAATETGDPLPAHLNKLATERLRRLADDIKDVPCEILVEDSQQAPRSILNAAAMYGADLIVIGSHGYHLVDRLLGTTAAHVVNRSTRDVLVVASLSRA
jgi:nucleotide-binding universal stress UspA family protein